MRERLAGTDQASLRSRGPEHDELRRSLLRGLRLAIVEPGYHGKRFVYERANELGIDLVLVAEGDSWSRELVDDGVARTFVEAGTTGRPEEVAVAVLSALGPEADRLDGVLSFWEDSVPAAARVAAALNLPGPPVTAADAARNKLRTLQASRDAALPTPRFMHQIGRAHV